MASHHHHHHHALAHAGEPEVKLRAAAAVVGAVTADAASMGLHWIYDVKELAAAVADGSDPAFHAHGTTYHAARKVGDTTMYGEATLVTARSLADRKRFVTADFVTRFYSTFGPGGSYHGYVDSATKDTVFNIMALQKKEHAAMMPPAGSSMPKPVLTFVFRQLKRVVEGARGAEEAASAAEAAVRADVPSITPDEVAYVRNAAVELEALNGTPVGSTDTGSNALAKIPALVARYAGHPDMLHVVTEATRATANVDDAITWSVFVARVLEAVLLGVPFLEALHVNIPRLDQPYRATVEHALKVATEAGSEDYIATVGKLGAACSLPSVVPSSLFLLARHGNTPDYATVVRENILAGGDSAGRAPFIGAIAAATGAVAGPAAATHGVPAGWLAQVMARDELVSLATGLHVAVHGEVTTDHLEVHKAPGTARSGVGAGSASL